MAAKRFILTVRPHCWADYSLLKSYCFCIDLVFLFCPVRPCPPQSFSQLPCSSSCEKNSFRRQNLAKNYWWMISNYFLSLSLLGNSESRVHLNWEAWRSWDYARFQMRFDCEVSRLRLRFCHLHLCPTTSRCSVGSSCSRIAHWEDSGQLLFPLPRSVTSKNYSSIWESADYQLA